MSIERFYTTTFTVKRFGYTANKGSLSTQGTFEGHLQQEDIERIQNLASKFTVSHSIWCAVGTDVNIGDQLETGGEKYTVRAIQTNNYGDNDHLELLVEQA